MDKRLSPLFARRSIRKYTSAAVSDQDVKAVLEAAMSAPSAVAKDPWLFLVIRDESVLQNMATLLPNGGMLRDAPVGILVCGDIEKAHGGLESYMIQDCSAAVENALLAASMMGLGACWLGVHPREERIAGMRELFNLPENVVPIAAIAVGWPGEEKEPRTRYDEAVVFYEQFSERE